MAGKNKQERIDALDAALRGRAAAGEAGGADMSADGASRAPEDGVVDARVNGHVKGVQPSAFSPADGALPDGEQEPELAALLAAADRLSNHRPRPSAGFERRMRHAIASWPVPPSAEHEGSPATISLPSSRPRALRRLALRTAGVAAAVALTFGGLRAVSADSGPGDLLWPVRRVIQRVEHAVLDTAAVLPGIGIGRQDAAKSVGGDAEDATSAGVASSALEGPTATSVARRGDRGAVLRRGRQGQDGEGGGAIAADAASNASLAGALAPAGATPTDPIAIVAAIEPASAPTIEVTAVTESAASSGSSAGGESRSESGGSSGSSGGSSGGGGDNQGGGSSAQETTPPPSATPSAVPPSRTPAPSTATPQPTPSPTEPTAIPSPNVPIDPGPATPTACRASIAGRIFLPDDTPAVGAEVRVIPRPALEPPPPEPWPWPIPEPDPNLPEPVRSNQDGDYRRNGLCPGDYIVFAEIVSAAGGPLGGVHLDPNGDFYIHVGGPDTLLMNIDVHLGTPIPPPPTPVSNAPTPPPGSGARPPGVLPAPPTATP